MGQDSMTRRQALQRMATLALGGAAATASALANRSKADGAARSAPGHPMSGNEPIVSTPPLLTIATAARYEISVQNVGEQEGYYTVVLCRYDAAGKPVYWPLDGFVEGQTRIEHVDVEGGRTVPVRFSVNRTGRYFTPYAVYAQVWEGKVLRTEGWTWVEPGITPTSAGF